LDADAANISEARKHIRSEGVYGKVSIQRLRGANLPYADSLVNLVVAEDLSGISADEVMRVLCPGGAAYIKKAGRWTKTKKPRPAEIDEWTHWLHDASGNAVARDRVAGPPRHLQWMARPFWARLHDAPSSTSAMVSSNGRIFYISDEAPAGTYENLEDKWFLVARDAFDGVLLWKRPLPDWGWKQWTADWHARNRSIFDVGHHHRCYRNKATERFLLTSRRGVEFTDVASGEIDLNHWARGDCHIGVMPCNGMLYTSPHPCSCYIELIWARRVAPRDRLIGSMGQLESAWPVHGSILVDDTSSGAVAYLAAGRSSYLDGGIHFYALSPETGEVLEHRVEYSPDPETGKMPDADASNVPGMLADILVGNGATVWMEV
jgi:hypothetical protein